MKRLYVATSWRNVYQPEIVRIAREMGLETYDFRIPEPGIYGFSWKSIDKSPVKGWSFERYREILAHPIAQEAFERDMHGLSADATLLVLPAGRSAHWELGYACGQGQRTAALYPTDIEMTAIGGHTLHVFDGLTQCEECGGSYQCDLRTKLRDDFEPELMVKGATDGVLIGEEELRSWLKKI